MKMEFRLAEFCSAAKFLLALITSIYLSCSPVDAVSPFGAGSFGDSSLYNIVISKKRVDPEDKSIEELSGNYVTMLNRKGRPFRCSIPSIPARVDEKDKLINLTTARIEEILIPTESNRQCVQLITSGWWHYEFCYGKNILQYHRDNGIMVPPIINLGEYSHSEDWSNVSKDALKRKPQDRHHTQYFVNGTECDLTGRRRESRVKFYCDTHKWPTDYIESVNEPQSCMYDIVVHSRRLCSIPYFKKEDPVIGEITCNPVHTPKSENKKQKKRSDPIIHMGKDLVENLLNEAATPVPESEMTDINIIPGESDSEAGIEHELQQTNEKMDLKLFKNSKFFIEKGANGQRKLDFAKQKAPPVDDDDDEDDLLVESQKLTNRLDSSGPTSFLEQAKIRAVLRGLDWVEREDIAKALLRIDFKKLGKLSDDEDRILQKFASILKWSKNFGSENAKLRKEAVKSTLDDYADMVEMFITSPDVRPHFQDAYEETFRLLHTMMKVFVSENDSDGPDEKIAEDEEDFPDDIQITEEMLGDGEKITEAVKKINFLALSPLKPSEETLFEALVDISVRMMDAHMHPEDAEDVYQLMDKFEDELVAVKRSMDANPDVRKVFKHKLSQFIRLLLAALNHWFTAAGVDIDETKPEEKQATLTKNLKYAEEWAAKAVGKNHPETVGDLMNSDESSAINGHADNAAQDPNEDDEEMTVDEKSINTLIWKGMSKTAIIASKDKSIGSDEKRSALRKARVILNYVVDLLKDPARKIRPGIRQKLLERVESMLVSLGKYEKTERSLTEIREARQKLESGDIDAETWAKQYGKAVENAKAVDVQNMRDRPTKIQPSTTKLPKPSFLPFGKSLAFKGKQPKSKALQFNDIIADMNPTNRKIREIENLIKERLQSIGGGPIEVKLVAGSDHMPGMGDIDMGQLEHIKKSLAGAFAAQLQGVFQQQFSVNELEENYSLDDDED